MAIEDAAVLAKCLGEAQNEAGRPSRPRCSATRACAARAWRGFSAPRGATARIYHLAGPLALARDLVIKAMGARRMLARQDWIYDWRV